MRMANLLPFASTLSLVSYSLITRSVLRGSPPRSDLASAISRCARPAGAKESPGKGIVPRHPGLKTLLPVPSARDAGCREGSIDDDSAQRYDD
jgi:hypothetical protein